ncbi:mucin-5AC-like [Scomber scombrus]|uniref:mucin-5AC-like n=1 Tax=Scomber scombrus TaxID=13677 RepID=UPI002DD7F75C|nr:mucin-5AC-like [Scomber scombrus]
MTSQLQPNREEEEEEEEEELTSFGCPPTLSITEEILEFINQSRAREGLTSIHTDITEQLLDQSKETQPPSSQTNFTCPLPPVICPSSPEQQSPTMQQEQDEAEAEVVSTFKSQTGGTEEEPENEPTADEVQEIPDATSQVEKGVEADVETQEEEEEEEVERQKVWKAKDEGEGETTLPLPTPTSLSSPIPTSDLQSSVSAEEERREASCPLPSEDQATTSFPNPDHRHPPIQSRQQPKRGSHLTKRDKKIIEKIRSYYKAAAEAEEEEEEEGEVDAEEDGQEGVGSRRRNSFSQIPSGLVKDSVSRFDVGGHQEEAEGEKHKTETIDGDVDQEVDSPTGPVSPQPPLSVDGENNGPADKPISSLDFEAEGESGLDKLPTFSTTQDNPNQVDLNLQSNPIKPVAEETEIQDQEPSEEGVEDEKEVKTSVVATAEKVGNSLQGDGPSIAKQSKCRDETTNNPLEQAVTNGPNQGAPAEPSPSHKEPSSPLQNSEQCDKTETKTQSNLTRTKQKDVLKTSGNLDDLPTQIKVGRWSRHSRIVTANRALFEGRGSDVAGIGFFEASPVVDPALMENSERILSKVQTLARMYSAKASTMKVPLHQKRIQSWSSTRPSGLSAQIPTKSQTQVESQTQIKHRQQTQIEANRQQKYELQSHTSDIKTETKSRTQTHSETKVQSHTRQQLQTQTKTYSQYQSQMMYQEEHRIQEERTDFQETATVPCEPLLFGHVLVKEQLTPACQHQTNGFTLSRPRDFISALSIEKDSSVDCGSDDNSQTFTKPEENVSTSPRDRSSDPAQDKSCKAVCISSDTFVASTASRHQLSAQPEDQSSTLGCSASDSPLMSTMTLDRSVTEFSDNCEILNLADTKETEKIERSEISAGLNSVNIKSNVSAHSIPPCNMSKDGDEQNKYKHDMPAAQYIQEKNSTQQNESESVHAGPEYLVCTGLGGGEGTPREVVLMVASTQNLVPNPGRTGEELQREGDLTSLSTSGGKDDPQSERKMLNDTKYDSNDSSSKTRMFVQGSTVVFSDEPPHYGSFQGSSHTVTELREGATPRPLVQSPPLVQSMDCLPTFTNQRPPDLTATMGKRALSNTWNTNNTTSYECSSREPDQQDSGFPTIPLIASPSSGSRSSSRPSMDTSGLLERPTQDADPIAAPSAFRPSLKHSSPSPIRAFSTSPTLPPSSSSSSSVRASPCSSPFRVVPAPSPTPSSTEGFPRALPCFSPPPPSSGRGSSMRAPPASSPTPSSMRAGPSSSPTPSSSLRSPPCSSPTASSSAFSRSLAASCISQSISQSIAKKNAARHQAQPSNMANQSPSSTPSLPSSHLRRRSPSPKLAPSQHGSSTPAYAQLGCTVDGYQHPRCPPSYFRSPSPSPVQSAPPSLSQRPPSPSMRLPHASSTSPCASFLHPKTDSSQNPNSNNNNNNNNNNTAAIRNAANITVCSINGAVSNGGWSVSQQRAPLANGSTNATVEQQTHDPLWSGSHNRVARPFSASEPSSRVQSPSPSPTPASFTRLCSPPPQHNYSSPMANKPPHPRSTRVGGVSSHNPLGLTLELPRASSASSSCLSPRILSPPPIGVSVNVWTNNVAAPQPRNPRLTSSSPSRSFSSSLGSPTLENATFPMSSTSYAPLHSSRSSSPSASWLPVSQTTSQTLRRSFSSNLADRPPSPARSNPSGLRRSWAESSRRSLGFSGSARGSFDQQESGLTSPRSGWSSYGSSPSCLSPRAGLQSPVSPGRLTPGKGSVGGQHFTSVPWPDVRELSSKYNGSDILDASATSDIVTYSPSPLSPLSHTLVSSPTPSDCQAEWGDPELEEGSCRSQLICAYVSRPSHEQQLPSACLVLSSSRITSPPPAPYQQPNYQVKPQPQVQHATAASPVPSVSSPLPSSSSPLPSTKLGNQKTSYATTVNLQIAGSGRITSFSTAQVSLTQTLQGGAGAGGGGGGSGQVPMARRVSINGLSHLPSPLPQNCNRL